MHDLFDKASCYQYIPLFHLPFILIRTGTQDQHMRGYLEKNMVTTTNFIEMTESMPNQGDLLSTKRYTCTPIYLYAASMIESVQCYLKQTVGNFSEEKQLISCHLV